MVIPQRGLVASLFDMFTHLNHGIQLEELECVTTPEARTYTTSDGKKYPSVTTVLKMQDKTALEKWRKRVGEDEANRVTTQASIRGEAVHKLAEDYLNNEPNWKRGAMPSNLFSFNQIKPILDKHVDNIMFQEAPLYSHYLRTAGRVDLIAEWDKERAIIDFKTSLRPKKLEHVHGYFMQESVYAVAFEERTGIPITKLVTVITVDGSEPQVFITDRDSHIHDFISLRSMYEDKYGF